MRQNVNCIGHKIGPYDAGRCKVARSWVRAGCGGRVLSAEGAENKLRPYGRWCLCVTEMLVVAGCGFVDCMGAAWLLYFTVSTWPWERPKTSGKKCSAAWVGGTS
jgi:hypothetical protein